jgi:hypothetical protein
MLHQLYWLVLSMMVSLSPTEDPIARHGRLATAIATVATEETPLFQDTEKHTGRERTAALLVAVAFRESSLNHDAIGDGGRSKCAMQIYGGSTTLLDDPVLCVRTGYRMLKESVRFDQAHPVAFYARGPRFKSEEARRISQDRMNLAAKVLGK